MPSDLISVERRSLTTQPPGSTPTRSPLELRAEQAYPEKHDQPARRIRCGGVGCGDDTRASRAGCGRGRTDGRYFRDTATTPGRATLRARRPRRVRPGARVTPRQRLDRRKAIPQDSPVVGGLDRAVLVRRPRRSAWQAPEGRADRDARRLARANDARIQGLLNRAPEPSRSCLPASRHGSRVVSVT